MLGGLSAMCRARRVCINQLWELFDIVKGIHSVQRIARCGSNARCTHPDGELTPCRALCSEAVPRILPLTPRPERGR
jgi:hypothetical protein